MIGLSLVKSVSKSWSFRPCGCSVAGCEPHQVDDVDHADLQIRDVLAQELHRRQSLQRRHVAGAGHDDVRLTAAVVAGPLPDPDPRGAVLDRLVHRQPLRRRVLARHHDVDVVAAPQAVVHHREQAVGIRRKVDPDDLGLLVDHMVDEAGVLVGEAVVVLPPDVRGQQDVQRGDRPPPGDMPGDLEPLGVLVEHRVDDVDEGLVAVEQPVTAGEQVAFEPALALVLAEHLHDPAVGGQVVVGRDDFGLPLLVRSPRTRRSSRLEAVSSGPKIRKLRCSALSLITSRRNLPRMRVSSFMMLPGWGTSIA